MPVNVTLLFSASIIWPPPKPICAAWSAASPPGLSPDVRSVASLFVSRWDKATMDKFPAELRNQLGSRVGMQAYRAYRELLDSDRWQRLMNLGARPQRLLFASTGTKDPNASDMLYIDRSPRRIPSTPCRRRRCWPLPTMAS